MSNKYTYEYTDTFAGEANYSWCKRGTITMPELTHYGFDGSRHYMAAHKRMARELVRRVKAEVGLTGVKCERAEYHDTIELRPYGSATVLFIYVEGD